MSKKLFIVGALLFAMSTTTVLAQEQSDNRVDEGAQSYGEFRCDAAMPDQVSAVILPNNDSVVAGTDISFYGELINESPYPIEGATLMARVFVKQDESDVQGNGNHLIGQFAALEDVSIEVGEILVPIEFSWTVPAFAPAGEYYATYYLQTSDGYNVMGNFNSESSSLYFSDFSVTSDQTSWPHFEKGETRVGGAAYEFDGDVPTISFGDSVETRISNPSDEPVKVLVEWTQKEKAISADENMFKESSVVELAPNETRIVGYQIKEQSGEYIYITATATYRDVKNYLNVTLREGEVSALDITKAHLAVDEVSGTAHIYGCVERISTEATGDISVALRDNAGVTLAEFTVAPDSDNFVKIDEEISTPEKGVAVAMYLSGSYVDGSNFEEQIYFSCQQLWGADCKEGSEEKVYSGFWPNEYLSNPLIFSGGVIILLLLLFLVWSVHKRHDIGPRFDAVQQTKPEKMLVIAFLILVGSFGIGAKDAEALMSAECSSVPGASISVYDVCANGSCRTNGMQTTSGPAGYGSIDAWSTWAVTYGGSTGYYNAFCSEFSPIDPATCTAVEFHEHNGLSFSIQINGSDRGTGSAASTGLRNCTIAAPSNNAPNIPTISGPTSGITGQSYSFSIQGDDPDGDQVRYQIDWDNNGTVDQTVPATGYVNSNTSQSAARSWSTTGSKTFSARTQDDNGATSGWGTHTISIGSVTASVNASNCTISAGNSACTVNVSWNSSNASSPSVRQDGSQFSTAASSGGTSRSITHGNHTFAFYNSGTLIDSDNAAATCASGTSWNGSLCQAPAPGCSSGVVTNVETSYENLYPVDCQSMSQGGNIGLPVCSDFSYTIGDAVANATDLANGTCMIGPTLQAGNQCSFKTVSISCDSAPASCDLGCEGSMTYTDPITNNSDDFTCPSGTRLEVTGGSWTGASCSGNYIGSPADAEVQCVPDASCSALATCTAGPETAYADFDGWADVRTAPNCNALNYVHPDDGGTGLYASFSVCNGGAEGQQITRNGCISRVEFNPASGPAYRCEVFANLCDGSEPLSAPTVDLEGNVEGGTWSSGNKSITVGEQVKLRWSTTDATSCSTDFDGSTAISNVPGGVDITEPGVGNSITYTVTCTGPGGSSSESITVTTNGVADLRAAVGNATPSTGFSATQPGYYEYVLFNLQILNDLGSASVPSAPYTVRFESDEDGDGTYTTIHNSGTLTTSAITAGGSYNQANYTIYDVPPGDYRITVVADPADIILESNDANNSAQSTGNLAALDPGIELEVTPSSVVRAGDTATIEWLVTNPAAVDECTFVGPGAPTGDVTSGGVVGTGDFDTPAVSGRYVYTLTCTAGASTFEETVTVESVGEFEEV